MSIAAIRRGTPPPLDDHEALVLAGLFGGTFIVVFSVLSFILFRRQR